MRAVAREPSFLRTHMNKLEAAWAWGLKANVNVERFVYEGMSLRLADGTRYTPDFFVVKKDGLIEFHETKGPVYREAARVRLHVCAEMYPEFRFLLIRQHPKVGWITTEIAGKGNERNHETRKPAG